MPKNKKIKYSRWLDANGPNSNIVISSRLRIARNLDRTQFPSIANKTQTQNTVKKINNAINTNPFFKSCTINTINKLSEKTKNLMMERDIINKDFLHGYGKELIIAKNEQYNILVNEEDHIRIQVIRSGLQLSDIWNTANTIDNELERNLNFAFSEKYGYLTACPTNIGTGIRASVMIHLPALKLLTQIGNLFKTIQQIGFTIRGFYGEGTDAIGDIYQVSNQITLGLTEKEIINNITNITNQIINYEINARKEIIEKDTLSITDKVWRSYGILQYAKSLNLIETMNYISDLRLGIDLDILKNINYSMLNRSYILIQPGHLKSIYSEESESNLNILRADIIKNNLKEVYK